MRGKQSRLRSNALGLFCLGVAITLNLGLAGCSGGSSGGTATPIQPTITSVTGAVNPLSITTTQTASFTATVAGTGNYTDTVNLAVSPTGAGTLSASTGVHSGAAVTFTPDASKGTQTVTITATSTQDSTKSGSAKVTVTTPIAVVPDVTDISPRTIYYPATTATNYFFQATLIGTGFASADVVHQADVATGLTSSYVDPTHMSVTLGFGTNTYSPGWLTFSVCTDQNVADCGASQSSAFLGGDADYLATSSSGELYSLDQAQGAPAGQQNGFVRKYKADGSSDGSCYVGSIGHSIAIDDKTPYMLVDAVIYNATGPNFGTDGNCDFTDVPNPQGLPSGQVIAAAARNGYAGLLQQVNSSVSFYDMTGGTGSQPAVHTASNLTTLPVAIAMGTFGTETDAFVLTVGGAPSLYKVRASDAFQEGAALKLSGITSIDTVQGGDPRTGKGGWQLAVFDSGSASGTVAVLSTYDQLLLFVNQNTWAVTKSVKLSGTPFRIAADVANGRVIVAYADPVNVQTTYAAVDVASGTVTPLSSTSSLLSVGLGVSADGSKIYSGMRSKLEVKAAQ